MPTREECAGATRTLLMTRLVEEGTGSPILKTSRTTGGTLPGAVSGTVASEMLATPEGRLEIKRLLNEID